MSLKRVWAILLQEVYITKRSLEVLVDLFFFSTITLIVFGFTSLFLTGKVHTGAAYYLVMGMVLWEIVRVSQYSITVECLWNIWSRNLSNMFVSPLTMREYIFALMVSATLKSLIVFTLMGLLAAFAFKFNIFSLGFINLSLFFLNLLIFSWSIGLFILGLILLFGTRIQALAWSLIFIFQPLSATFFPVKILPLFLQPLSYLIPSTYVFEAARFSFGNHRIAWGMLGLSLIENMIYFGFTVWLFRKMFAKSKENGQFARNEG